jgi:cation diffusion facilitator CzcD-associated flavoprotein CzcO
VLVVGAGNSGAEIALDLLEHGARPTMAVRGRVNVIPREILGRPFLDWAIALSPLPPRVADALAAPVVRLRLGNVRRLGLRPPAEGPMTQSARHGRVALIDVGTVGAIRSGAISVRPGIERFEEDGVVFEDGSAARFDAVVLATGFRPALEFLGPDAAPALDGARRPRVSGASGVPGLWFCGFHVPATGMLRKIAAEARAIARGIAPRRRRRERARAQRGTPPTEGARLEMDAVTPR